MAFMKFSFLASTGFVPSSICSSSCARCQGTGWMRVSVTVLLCKEVDPYRS